MDEELSDGVSSSQNHIGMAKTKNQMAEKICACMCVCVCVCVCIYIYIYIYVCMCMDEELSDGVSSSQNHIGIAKTKNQMAEKICVCVYIYI